MPNLYVKLTAGSPISQTIEYVEQSAVKKVKVQLHSDIFFSIA